MLESVCAQGMEDFEVIVVDNGSTDNTASIVSDAALRYPGIRLVQSEVTNAGAARNFGIAQSKGRYLVFADADDIVPDGAYRAMLESLESSGSDMAIGDHLKFSAQRTWSPTRRWYLFDSARSGVAAVDVPELLSGRSCWNRMIRRSFWDRVRLRFPEIQSVEDIEPMTRAFVEAKSLDVVPFCVYLYRDRGDASSLSRRSDSDVTVRYLEQELACTRLVQNNPVLRRQHAEIVLDADGWAHLHRFLSTNPADDEIAAVEQAAAALLKVIPLADLDQVAPPRRALWQLVLAGEWSAARSFVMRTSDGSESGRLSAWIDAVALTQQWDEPAASALAVEGLVPALVNGAEGLPAAWFADRLTTIEDVELASTGSVLLDAMISALRAANHSAVPTISALRHMVPLVVDRVDASERGMFIGGPADIRLLKTRGVFELVGSGGESKVPLEAETGRWRAELTDDGLEPGRYSAAVSFNGILGSFPVVTARMPLPPVDEGFALQPLADRKDGWRFLVDRRMPRRRSIGGLLRNVVRRGR
ncbi:hypothetical protein BIU96_17595 [Curtobacterium sp. MCBA15_008]|nr:hypothetical protein BIU96_17595 [Curtobacterium sp. MCBA15_008]